MIMLPPPLPTLKYAKNTDINTDYWILTDADTDYTDADIWNI